MFTETLLLKVGSAVAKSIISLWLQGDLVLKDTSGASIDVLVAEIPNLGVFERRRLVRQFERTAEAVAEKLAPFLEVEFGGLPENERKAAVLAVADSFEQANVSTQLLLSQDLDPLRLEDHLRRTGMKDRALLIPAAGILYDHLLRETCNYTVEIAVTLPPFASQAARESLRRESEIIDLIHTVLSKLPDSAPAGRDDTDADLQFETQYRRTVARRLDYLELFGLDVSPISKRYALSVAYITLSASGAESGDDDGDEAYMRVNEALAGGRRMLVRGDAGSGKTTLLQWLAVSSARRNFAGALNSWNDGVPFFIQLRRYAGKDLPRPEQFVAAVAPNEAGRMPEGWTHRQLESGRALVLIDGVDELSEDDRKRAQDWLLDLTATFKAAYYVVTSRPTTPENWLNAAEFRNCVLQPMTLGDVDSFVGHWHDAIRSALSAASDRAQLHQMSARLMATLRARPPVRSLATNPLLCAMICALHRERSEQLPEDRMELYRVALELLLERRDLERGVLPDGVRLTLKEKQIFLRDLAYWLVLNNYSDAGQGDVVEHIERKLPSMQRIRSERAYTIFRYLLERSGILRMPTLGRVDFVHRTFQEYLAAEEIIEQANIGMLIENARHDHWREVIVLAAGHASLRQRQELLSRLLHRGDSQPGQRHRLHLLACACLETSPEVSPELAADLQRALSKLLPPKNMTEAQAVASAGQLAVPLLRGFQNERARTAAACVRALALAGGQEALDVLETYGNDSRRTVWSELVRIWSALYFDPVEFSSRVLAQQTFYGYALRIDSLFLLPSVGCMPNARRLRIFAHPDQGELSIIGELQSVRFLDIERGDKLSDLSPLGALKQVKELRIRRSPMIGDLSPLSNLTELQELELSQCGISDLTPLSNLTQLTDLHISSTEISDLGPLAGLTGLKRLNLSGCSGVADVTPLSNLTHLSELNLNQTTISDLTPLDRLTELTRLDLFRCSVSDLAPLAGLARIRRLDLGRNNVSDLAPLSHLSELSNLDIFECPVSDLMPLAQLRNLKQLRMGYTPAIFDPELENTFRSLNKLTVYMKAGDELPLGAQWQSIGGRAITMDEFIYISHESAAPD